MVRDSGLTHQVTAMDTLIEGHDELMRTKVQSVVEKSG